MNRFLSLGFCAALFLAPLQAHAHSHLTRSTPAEASRLKVSPSVIQLWFSESPELALTAVQLIGPDGKSYTLGARKLNVSNGLEIDIPIEESLIPGKYTVTWRTAAADGHPSHGNFTFVMLPPATTVTAVPQVATHDTAVTEPATAAGTPEGNDNPAASSPNSLTRAFLFLGLLLLIGAMTFSLIVVPRAGRVTSGSRDVMKRRAAGLGMIAAIVIVIAALLRLYLELRMMRAMPDMPGMAGFSNQQMVVHTTWGLAFLAQIAAACIAFIALAFTRRGVIPAWYIAAGAAISLAITPALSGHAVSSPRFTSLMVLSDWLHVLGAASWLGSLACVMMIGVPLALRQEGDERWLWVSSLVNEFSKVALVSVPIVLASGVFASVVHVAHLSDLWRTDYGKLLLMKLVLVCVTLVIGAYNFKRVQPRLNVEQGTVRLRNSAALELAAGFLILLATGFLTGLSP